VAKSEREMKEIIKIVFNKRGRVKRRSGSGKE
jgi:hypothetical protein